MPSTNFFDQVGPMVERHRRGPGGAILMALCDGEVVGTVALISKGSGSYELETPQHSSP